MSQRLAQQDTLPKGPIAEKFQQMTDEFSGVRSRAVNLTSFATPSIFPEEFWDENSDLKTNWQSTLANGINNIASKFTTTTISPASTPIEFAIKGDILNELHANAPQSIPILRAALASEANTAHQHLMNSNLWTSTYAALQLAGCTGNSLVYQDDDLNFSTYNMWNFHVHRKMNGLEHEILVRDWYQLEDLPEHWLKLVKDNVSAEKMKVIEDEMYPIPVIGKIRHMGGTRWQVTREAVGVVLEVAEFNGGSTGPNPYASFMWEWVPGKHYGRGLLEVLFGDIRVHDGQSRSITEGAAAASRVIPFLSPDAITHIDDLDENNGRIIVGRADDLTFSGMARSLNLDWAIMHNEQVRERIDRVMMNDVAVFPTGERVTATHIRAIKEAIRERHGGVAAQLVKYQKPVYGRSVYTMQQKKWISKEIKLTGAKAPFELRVKTSADPFGGGDEMERYMTFTQVSKELGQEGEKRLNAEAVLVDSARILGLDARTLIHSNEELEAQVQKQAQMEQAQMASQEAIKVQGQQAVQQSAPQAPQQ